MSKIEFEARQLGRSMGYGIGADDVNDNAIFDYLNGFMKEADRLWFEEQLAKPDVEMRTQKLAESLGVEYHKPSPADLNIKFEARQLGRSLGYEIGPDDVNDNAIFDYLNGFMKEADRLWFEEQLAKPDVEMRTQKLAESLGVEYDKPSMDRKID